MPDEWPEIMVINEVAIYLRTSTATVYRLMKAKKLPGYKVGLAWRFNKEQVDLWRMRNKVPGRRSE